MIKAKKVLFTTKGAFMFAFITEIFYQIDDFIKTVNCDASKKTLPRPERRCNRSCLLSVSEVVIIEILFHLVTIGISNPITRNALSLTCGNIFRIWSIIIAF